MNDAIRIVAVFGLIAFSACSRGGAPNPSPQAAADARRFPLEGRVVSADPLKQEATIAHEDIPNYMPAMTMLFPVRGATAWKPLVRGARVSGTLVVSGDEYWLEDVVVTASAPEGAEAEPAPPPPAEPSPGAAVPDAELINQDGRSIHLADFRGRAWALTFIFTRCPLPEFCPRVTSSFSEVQELLAKRPGMFAKTALLSISFDTEFDRPRVLRAFGLRHQRPEAGAPFSHWQLATGTPEEIQRLGSFFGLEYEEEAGQFTHNLRTAVIAPDGKLVSVRRGSDWTAEQIVADLERAAGK